MLILVKENPSKSGFLCLQHFLFLAVGGRGLQWPCHHVLRVLVEYLLFMVFLFLFVMEMRQRSCGFIAVIHGSSLPETPFLTLFPI